MRKIPATNVTQHPDHANKPYFLKEAFISTRDESEECYRSFAELGATEYKWDWEGKLVDESVLERLFSELKAQGSLISRRVSRLDAFSVYLFRI